MAARYRKPDRRERFACGIGIGFGIVMTAPSNSHARLRTIFRFRLASALLPMPGMALLLIGGYLLGEPVAASIAAGAAFSVGFGATKRVWRSRRYAMLITASGMTAVAFLGTVVGLDTRVELAATAAMGGLFGALSRLSGDLWWIWLQIIIAFLLAANFPGGAADGLYRAGLVAAGAVIQCASVWMMHRLFGEAPAIAQAAPVVAARVEVVLHALRAAICIGAALIASQAVGFEHTYWAPMTAMLILKPGLRDTGWRGLERIGGTIVGLVLATGVVSLTSSVPLLLALAAVLAAGMAFGFQQARYTVLSAAITATVILMIALAGGEVLGADRERMLATLMGGAIALSCAAIAPRRPLWRRDAGDRA